MKLISAQELKSWMDNSEKFQLIDIREDYEYQACNINGEHIPMGEILSNLDKISKDKKVVIHCRSGVRGEAVVRALEEKGYTNVYNLEGGICAWAEHIDASLSIL
jgi:rhodanese-related sulfurtransferase